MQFQIIRDSQQLGTYPIEQVQSMLANGQLFPTDLAHFEGAPNWMPLSQALQVCQQATGSDNLENYNRFSETVGGLSLRAKDNLIQAIAVGAGVVLGGVIGFFLDGRMGAIMGAVIGLVGMTFLSGIVLGIMRRFYKGS
jgi:hypothetical protein